MRKLLFYFGVSLLIHLLVVVSFVWVGRWEERGAMPTEGGGVEIVSLGERMSQERGGKAGMGEGSGVGTGSGRESGRDEILTEIRKRIERAKKYPLLAERQRLEGRTEVSFEISSDGGIAACAITQSSGSPLLDDEAVATIRRGVPYPSYEGPLRVKIDFFLDH